MSGPEITIGLSISLSGRFSLQGQQALHGFLLWQSWINAQGGVAVRNGEKRSVRLIWYDDHSRISCRHFQAHPLQATFSPIASMLLAALVVLALVLSPR